MLNIAVKAAGRTGEPKLRELAEKLVECGLQGEGWAIKEIADRIDGKVPQAVEGSSDAPLAIELIRRVIVDAKA